mmetsp:Transcript_29560/g.63923  ORF Transcript_29560/g.63923 Transcript_29560/m.63923 type:complete len:95 (-) Transcript_29560:426-710(-)
MTNMPGASLSTSTNPSPEMLHFGNASFAMATYLYSSSNHAEEKCKQHRQHFQLNNASEIKNWSGKLILLERSCLARAAWLERATITQAWLWAII